MIPWLNRAFTCLLTGQHCGRGRLWTVPTHRRRQSQASTWKTLQQEEDVQTCRPKEEVHCRREPVLDGSRDAEWWEEKMKCRHDLRRMCFRVSQLIHMILFFIISGKRYDEKVDIFSFGIVLCEVRTDVTLIICSDNKAHSLQTAVLKTASAELYRWIMTTKPWQNIIPLNALEKNNM